MRGNPKILLNDAEITELLKKSMQKVSACQWAKFGPIIQSDIPGKWTVHLSGNPSGSCQRAFIAVRTDLQDRIEIAPYEKGFY